MNFFIFVNAVGLLINTINIPFDNGANIFGSNRAPYIINKNLDFLNIINNYTVSTKNNHVNNILGYGYFHVWNTLDCNILPLVIGGDHTISVASISAANDYCILQKQNMGVLWIDAHADFNTIQTTTTGNLHSLPVSILCGHTLPSLSFGENLCCDQFAFYGLCDMDTLEFERFQDYNMKILETDIEICEWIKKYDKIYISLDLDAIDPTEFNYTNTPIPNGLSIKKICNTLEIIKNSNKILGIDIVEFNPNKGEDTTVITEIISSALL